MRQVNLKVWHSMLTVLACLFLSVGAYAQQLSVKGIVKDQTGEPVIGANVLVKGTTNGVITNIDGEFTLAAKKGDILSVSYVATPHKRYPFLRSS